MNEDKKYLDTFKSLEEEYLSGLDSSSPLIGYLCLRTPVELIEAMNAVPVRIVPTSDFNRYDYNKVRPDGCSFCRMIPSILKTEQYQNLKAIIGGSCCDQMRRIMDTLGRELMIPVILFGAPRSWNANGEYFLSEMKNAFRNLSEKINSDINSEALSRKINLRNKLKQKVKYLRETGGLPNILLNKIAASPCPPEIILEFLKDLEILNSEMANVRLMLAGSIPGEWEVGEIEQAGGKLVADATCLGDRAFHTLTAETGDLFNNLYQSCVAENLCPHRRPQLPTLKYLRQLTEEQKVEGIVYLTLKYCHPWGLSAPRIRQFLPEFPMLILDDDLSSPALTNFRTRVGAFVETLTSRKRSDREILHETKFQQTGV